METLECYKARARISNEYINIMINISKNPIDVPFIVEITGWEKTDKLLKDALGQLKNSNNGSDYAAVGNTCVHVLENLSEILYNEYVPADEKGEISKDKTVDRIHAFIDSQTPKTNDPRLENLMKQLPENVYNYNKVLQQLKHDANLTKIHALLCYESISSLVRKMYILANKSILE